MFGNPFEVDERHTPEEAVEAYHEVLQASKATRDLARSELRGKNLACWCKIGEPCHADLLLEIANR